MSFVTVLKVIAPYAQRAIVKTMNTEYQKTNRDLFSTQPSRIGGVGLIAGILIGSALMYLLDPRQGNRRRAVARDKVWSLASRSSTNAGKTYRHLRNKIGGVVANLTQTLRPEGATSDRKLCDRIRSTVGRTLAHPHQVDFAVHAGRVTVRGDLKPHEAGQVIQAIERVAGVVSVDNQIVDTSAVQ
jgi:hypothetical protein